MTIVKKTADGAYLVYDYGQAPIEGVAVYRYRNGVWACDIDGSSSKTTNEDCVHVRRVQSEIASPNPLTHYAK